MPRDVSSSSEDEADSPVSGTETQAKAPEKTMRYQCPADFVTFSHKTCSSTLTDALKKNHAELWLIKAPSSFNPERFRGLQVPLSGLQTLKVPAAEGEASDRNHQIYSVLASTHGTSDLRLLTKARPSSDGVAFGPAFSGLLNVCETYGDADANQSPQVIPAAPAPIIPPGLKQRFHPFGSKTPTLTCVAESEVDGAAHGPSSTTLRPLVKKRFIEETRAEEEEEEEGRRRKKKKKKEKRVKTELPDDVDALVKVKTEPAVMVRDERMAELVPFQEDADTASDERRKKKKKKKEREREEGLEPSVQVKQEEVTVKCEPVDASYGDAVDGKKKKKKKKKNKTDDD